MWCVHCRRAVPYSAFFCPRCGKRTRFSPWLVMALAFAARVWTEVKLRSEEQRRRIHAERNRSRDRPRQFPSGKARPNLLVDKSEPVPVP